MTITATQQTAKIFGAIAFAKGIKCAPCLCKEMMGMLKGREIGDKRTAKELAAWMAGWTEANLAK